MTEEYRKGRLVGFADDRDVYAGGYCTRVPDDSSDEDDDPSDDPSDSSGSSEDGCVFACDECGPDPDHDTPIGYLVEITGVTAGASGACCEDLNGVYLLEQDPDAEGTACRWYLELVSPCNGETIFFTIDRPYDNVLRLYIQAAEGGAFLAQYTTEMTIIDSGPGYIVVDCHVDVIMDEDSCATAGCNCPTSVHVTAVAGSLCDGSSSSSDDGSGSGSWSGSGSGSGSGPIDASGGIE